MKMLIPGATGCTAMQRLREAINRGHEVYVPVRDASRVKIQSTTLTLFVGNPGNRVSLSRALYGCDAVLSALNISRTSDFPWSPLRTPADFLENMLKRLIELMSKEEIKRLILTSAWGVGDSREEIPGWFRWVIDHSNVGKAYAQHDVQEKMLRESALDWTAVRPVGLNNCKKLKRLVVSEHGKPKPGLLISRKQTAGFMLDCLELKTYIGEAPVISEK